MNPFTGLLTDQRVCPVQVRAKWRKRALAHFAQELSLDARGDGCGSKLIRRGKPQVLVNVSTYQGSILGTGFLSHSQMGLCLNVS